MDLKIVELINQRAAAAREIGKLKNNTNLPIYEPEREKKILALINESADRLCGTVPTEGRSSSAEVSGKAKAELIGLLKKVSDLGIEGAAVGCPAQRGWSRGVPDGADRARGCPAQRG